MAKRPRNRALAAAAGQAGTAQAGTAQAGTGTAPLATPAGTDAGTDYPGERFGLPPQGPMSVASMGRRLLALVTDWLLSTVIALWLTHSQLWTLAVFSAEVLVLTALTGTTVGKRLCGIRVIRTDGGLVGFPRALVRTALLLTVVLPLLTDFDRRGVHDRAAGTIVVRL
jgi:RDD family